MKKAILFLAGAGYLLAGCGGPGSEPATASPAATSAAAAIASPARPEATPTRDAKTGKPAASCGPVAEPGQRFIAEQSFPFDYEPFRGSCFVTFADIKAMVDEKDVPRGSTFHLYKDGKQVFQFPDGFKFKDSWIEAVSFDDLNGDGLTDVIIAGEWLGTNFSAPTNVVYVNTGSTFTTNKDANQKLDKLSSIAKIKKAVKRDLKSFFPVNQATEPRSE